MARTGTYRPDHQTTSLPRQSFASVGTRFRRLAKTHLAAALITHATFLMIFWALNVWLLVAVNVFSVLIYGFCLLGLKHTWLRPVTRPLAWLEIIGHAVIASLVLGADSGFHYYLVVLLPFLFIDPHTRTSNRLAGLLVLMTLFIGLDLTTSHGTPWVQLGDDTLAFLRTVNTIICFLSLSSLVSFHAQASRKSERDLQKLADTDLLTGIGNRRSLIDEAASHMRRNCSGRPVAFILIDLDHFKYLNDHYGHAFGDKVLSQTASLMNDLMRPDDSLARWGGEEFLIMVRNADLHAATRVAERLCSAIGDQVFDTGEGEIRITATLGVAEWQPDESMDSCVSRADEALYRGKQKGRSRVETEEAG